MRGVFQEVWAWGGKIMGESEQERSGNSGGNSGSSVEGELRCGGQRIRLWGRALRLIIWLAGHQTRINETAPESGQIWLTWKGDGPRSIDGDIRTRL